MFKFVILHTMDPLTLIRFQRSIKSASHWTPSSHSSAQFRSLFQLLCSYRTGVSIKMGLGAFAIEESASIPSAVQIGSLCYRLGILVVSGGFRGARGPWRAGGMKTYIRHCWW